MQEIDQLNAHLTEDDLSRAFPFRIRIDSNLTITLFGRGLKKIVPTICVGDILSQHFQILTPTESLEWKQIARNTDDLWILQALASGLKLRGQILCKPQVIDFLISPWLNDAKELVQHQLNMYDFAIHDPVHDFLLLKQAEKIALEDTRKINQELMRERETLRRLNLELEIKEAHARQLSEIISKSSNGICTIQQDGLISWANDAFTQITHMSLDRLIGQAFLNLPLMQHETTSNRQKIHDQMAKLANFDTELCFLKENGQDQTEWFEINFQPFISASGQLVSYLVFFRDITFKKATTTRLAHLTANLTNIFELCPDGIIAFDLDGIHTYSNSSLYRLTELDPARISEMSIIQFNAIIAQISLQASNLDDSTTTLVFSQPKTTIIKRTTKQSLDSHGQVISTIQYFKDITYEYEMEQMKSEFLSLAAHELRTPMSSVHGFTELLINRDFPTDQQKEMMLIIHRQTTRLIEMLNDLLDLAKIETKGVNALTLRNHNLVDIIHDVSAEFAIDMQLDLHLPNQPVYILADQHKMMRAIGNVLSNAKKYSPAGSVVKVALANSDPHNMASLIIEDHGSGITPANMDKLFTKFFRADNSGKTSGTGLGLCIVKEIIELHGGRVEVSSQFGKGTIVKLTIPSLITN